MPIFHLKEWIGEMLLLKLDEIRNLHICSVLLVTQEKACLLMYLPQFGLTPEYINGTLRVTFGEENTKEDVDFLVDNLYKVIYGT